MSLVVTGIAQSPDVSALHEALAAAGLSGTMRIVTPDDVVGTSRPGGLAGSQLLTSGGGTGVPGLSGGSLRLGDFFSHDSASDKLGDLDIPDSAAANYLEALDRGKTIVGYFASVETLTAAAEVFRSAGMMNVRIF